MTGEQMTLVLGLIVFGLLVLLLSRGRTKATEEFTRTKPKPIKSTRKKRR